MLHVTIMKWNFLYEITNMVVFIVDGSSVVSSLLKHDDKNF
jgi:hypothetical protein